MRRTAADDEQKDTYGNYDKGSLHVHGLSEKHAGVQCRRRIINIIIINRERARAHTPTIHAVAAAAGVPVGCCSGCRVSFCSVGRRTTD